MTRRIPISFSSPQWPVAPIALLLLALVTLASCSMTKDIPADDQLFTGLEKIVYQGAEQNDNMIETQEELEAALATAPNGSLFGSSYYRVPFSFGVTVWNKYSEKTSGFARWMTKTFGKQPVLMSWVNPELRSSVAQNVLRNHGYFSGRVSYEPITRKNPKEAKIRYTVTPGPLHYLDSIGYFGFPAEPDSLIRNSLDEATIHRGDPFVVSRLEAERQRISTLLRNNGYYFYQPDYASYLADTFVVDGKAQLRFQLAKDIPAEATRPWVIGRITINMKKTFMEQPTDSFRGRFFTISYSGKKPPIRPRVLLADLKLRPRQLYSYSNYVESASKINAMGLFSSTDFRFTARPLAAADSANRARAAAANDSLRARYLRMLSDSTARMSRADSLRYQRLFSAPLVLDTLDLTLNCTFDKPWDFYIETDVNARTIGRIGPEVKMGVTRRNAFRGGEKIDVNVHGSYEWATSSGSSMNNYEYGADASVEFPRIIAPFVNSTTMFRRTKNGQIRRRRRLFYSTPTTLAKAATDIIYRPGYYKMHVVSGEWTYRWQTSERSRHEFSPITVKYQYMNSHTHSFDSVMTVNPYLKSIMSDYFIPMMRYTYVYTSPSTLLHPIRWETTLAESGNVTSLCKMMIGQSWDRKGKTLFQNAYSHFLKLETDFTKTWTLSNSSKLLGHVNAGVVYAYGNSEYVPNSEMFYVGGANSIRAFSVRGIGPGSFPGLSDKAYSYLVQNGDMKLVANLEYRRQLFGDLYAALFVDAGNVWNMRDNYNVGLAGQYDGITKFRFSNFFKEIAVGTGIGLRYDLDFLILRLDWGVAVHMPYDTGKSGFYNVDRFKNSHTLHFAIGYPF